MAFDVVLERKDLDVRQEEQIVFGPFRFGLTTERLWIEEREIPLRARAKAVLRYLVTHPGRVIPREEFVQHGAYTEALAHCQQGLALIERLPETTQRLRQELALQTCFSTVLTATQGRASPELEQGLRRAQALCQALDVTAERVLILIRLMRLSMVRADRETTEALLAEERRLLEGLHDAGLLVQLHTQLGTAETIRGAYARAEAHQTEALRLTATNFDRRWEAELHRLRGELLLQAGKKSLGKGQGTAEAAGCFQQALAIARQEEAKALELRAAMSLSRLWQTQGKHTAARTLLAEIYGWFIEGFDTADLQEARMLLKDLSS